MHALAMRTNPARAWVAVLGWPSNVGDDNWGDIEWPLNSMSHIIWDSIN